MTEEDKQQWDREIVQSVIHIARAMGVRIYHRTIPQILSDIERYIEVSMYKKHINPVGKVSTWP